MNSFLAVIDAAVTPLSDSSSFSLPILRLFTNYPVLFASLVVILLSLLLPLVWSYLSRLPNEPPFVFSYIPYIGSAISFSKHPNHYLSSCRAKYGEIFTINLLSKRMHFICDPLSYAAVFKNKSLSFSVVSDQINRQVLDLSSQAVADEEVKKLIHNQYIKHLQHHSGTNELTINSYIQTSRWLRSDYLAKKDSVQTIGLNKLVTDVLFHAVAHAVYGPSLDTHELFEQFHQFDDSFPLLVLGVPSWLVKQGIIARSRLIDRFTVTDNQDGESSLIRARREVLVTKMKDNIFTLHDIGAAQMAILWAASANTIPACFWTMAYLLTHPAAFKAVKQEIESLLPKRPLLSSADIDHDSDSNNNDDPRTLAWTREQCAELKILDSAITEALRLSTGSMMLRLAIEDTNITMNDGKTYHIRAGDNVAIYPSLTHLDDRIFHHANIYQYDRFLIPSANNNNNNSSNDSSISKIARDGLLPFGGGVSQCPGRYWAKNEIIIAIALILQHMDIQLIDPLDIAISSFPSFDYSRVGIGVFPPKGDIQISYKYIE